MPEEKKAKPSIIQLALTAGSGPKWKKEDLLIVLYWLKQVLALFLGVAFGLVGVEGANGIGGFGILVVVLTFLYYRQYLGVDDLENEWRMELHQEGFMPAFGLFLLSWIFCYNL